MSKFLDSANYVAGMRIWSVAQISPTAEEVIRIVNQWAKLMDVEHPGLPKVVFVDQLSHIVDSSPRQWDMWERAGVPTRLPRPPRPGSNDTTILEWKANMMRIMATHLDVLAFLVAQLNENHDDEKPGLRSMRASRGINHVSDIVLMPYRPYVSAAPTVDTPGYTGVDPFADVAVPDAAGSQGPDGAKAAKLREKSGKAWILAPKNRHGEEFEARVWWDGPTQRFIDYEDVEPDLEKPYEPVPEFTDQQVGALAKYKELTDRIETARLEREQAYAAQEAAPPTPAQIEAPHPATTVTDEPAGYDLPPWADTDN